MPMSRHLAEPKAPRFPIRRCLLAFGLPVCAGLLIYGVSKWAEGPRAEAANPVAGQQHQNGVANAEQPPAQPAPAAESSATARIEDGLPHVAAPDLDGGIDWLNSAGPITLRDLRGKIVLLDFWTLCCINCMHTLPDLARLEKKYPNQLVVVGVHSAKFENERNSESIRKAILRYEISHPVVNDANMRIWQRYGVSSWPTLFLIDPEGYAVWAAAGEGLFDSADAVISKLIKIHRRKKTLDEQPLAFKLARLGERGDTPLFFPGKVLADAAGSRLFIADSTHHRIVITDLTGKKIAIAGTGEPDHKDGPFDQACFNDPQGMALQGDTLYVADRRNHLLRALDLKAHTVRTIAGNGTHGQDRRRGGPALQVGLNSPWDLYLHVNTLFIAMAGFHQIWSLDLRTGVVAPYAGNGREDIVDGPLSRASFAQPSGLAGDGKHLYVADSEVSAVRAVPLWGRGDVQSIIGEGLFEFGDHDGIGREVRLQHALGAAWHDGKLYIADTYNSKIKAIDPEKQSCTSLLGGKTAGWLTGSLFSEPGGLSFAGDRMYVADTNNHRIRVVDLKTKAVSTLNLQSVEAPKLVQNSDPPSFPNAVRQTLPVTRVPKEGEVAIEVELHLVAGFKLNPETKMSYTLETLPEGGRAWSESKKISEPNTSFRLSVPLDKVAGSNGLRLSLVYYECGQGSQAICRVKSQIWDIPLKFDAAARERVIHLAARESKVKQ
jgi:thiol-disulfide isomerase/thioredoxin